MTARFRSLLRVLSTAAFAATIGHAAFADDGIVNEKAPPAQPSPAAPPEKGKDAGNQRGVITLAEVTITGRIQKPIAAVDVSRIQPRLTLAELRQPFLERIEKAIYSDPF